MKQVIIFGANGMAGHIISKILKTKKEYNIIDICHTKGLDKDSVLMDINHINCVKYLIQKTKAEVIINCTGILNKRAEDNPHDAIYVNSYFPRFLEEYCKDSPTKIIHLSTDCVFSGRDGQYTEDSFKDGRGMYSQTKSLGEINNNKDLTIRTSIIGPELKGNGIGLFDWFMRQKGEVSGYSKVYWTGITTLQLAISIDSLIQADVTGLYHLVPSYSVTKCRLLNIIKHVFNKEIIICENDLPVVDKSLVNTRVDYKTDIPDYKEMLEQLYEYILENKSLYNMYFNH